MRKWLLASLALLSAPPALAQVWDGGGQSMIERPVPVPGVRREIEQTRQDIRDGRRAGQLSRREARSLRREGFAIDGLEDRYRNAGLSDSERAELQFRAEALSDLVAAQRSRPPR